MTATTSTTAGVAETSADASPLTPEQEAARRQVLASLEGSPDIRRAFVSRWDDDIMILTLAVRGIGTCELMISAERLKTPADYTELTACLLNAEGSA